MLNNGFLVHTHIAPNPRQHTMTPNQKTETTRIKWAPFTYIGRETTFITNIFKKADLRITLRTNNTLQKLLMQKTQTLVKYSRSRAYKLTCLDCNRACVGHLGPKETLQTMPNTFWNIHTRLAPFIKQCRFCNTNVREPTSTP